MQKIKDLGKIDGPLLCFGGVYSNLQALEALKDLAEAQGFPPDRIVCTGDIAGYCANPEECQQLIQEWGIHVIAGNVEIQLRDGLDDCGCDFSADSRCDLFAKEWYPYAQKKTSPETIAWLQTLPEFIRFNYYGKTCLVVHGSWFHTSDFVFASTPWSEKEKNFEATSTDVIIGGHCGLPFSESQNERYWLNPGVIGMPANDGTTRVWYMILRPKDQSISFEHQSFDFDHEEAFARMLETELPISYAQTLTSGLWDNNDILPIPETRAQGQGLSFKTLRTPFSLV